MTTLSLLDQVFAATTAGPPTSSPAASNVLDRFLSERSDVESLKLWRSHSGIRDKIQTVPQLQRLLSRDIARLDRLLNAQLNAILHHPRFQKLEGSWRGLQYLTEQVEDGAAVKIRVLDLSWKELTRDMERAMEFDQSHFFRKVYNEEFDLSGGEPYSVLLCDHEVRLRPGPGAPTDDLATLKSVMQVAAASFAPFITSASPALFGLESFAELQRPMNLTRMFEQKEYVRWNALRDQDDARFLGMVMPRMLLREPWPDDGSRADGFCFREDTSDPHLKGHLFGNAIYGLGAVMIRAFCRSGWLADIRGVRRDHEEGGLLTDLPHHHFSTDTRGIASRTSTDVALTDLQEAELSELGFASLCPCRDSHFSAFHSTPSLQRPKKYDEESATVNARLSSMLHYMLCVGRIAHYIKVLGREKVGSFADPTDCEAYLNDWLQRYVTYDADASDEVKAQYPLRAAEATVTEHPGKPGCYFTTVHLQPHYQLDDMVSAVKLTTELGQVG
ncbi:MAG: type VI secretion system contractile sheath large subunit [Fuerstiella sp.]